LRIQNGLISALDANTLPIYIKDIKDPMKKFYKKFSKDIKI